MTTKRQIGNVEYPSLIAIDSTYKLNYNGNPSVLVGTIDANRHFHLFCLCLVTNKTTFTCVYIFESIVLVAEMASNIIQRSLCSMGLCQWRMQLNIFSARQLNYWTVTALSLKMLKMPKVSKGNRVDNPIQSKLLKKDTAYLWKNGRNTLNSAIIWVTYENHEYWHLDHLFLYHHQIIVLKIKIGR